MSNLYFFERTRTQLKLDKNFSFSRYFQCVNTQHSIFCMCCETNWTYTVRAFLLFVWNRKKHQQLLRNMCKCCVWATSFVFSMQSFARTQTHNSCMYMERHTHTHASDTQRSKRCVVGAVVVSVVAIAVAAFHIGFQLFASLFRILIPSKHSTNFDNGFCLYFNYNRVCISTDENKLSEIICRNSRCRENWEL